MTSKCLLLEKEPSCRQWSTSSCQRLHFTWKSVNVCAPPGWRKMAERLESVLTRSEYLFEPISKFNFQNIILSAAKTDKWKLEVVHCRTASCWADCPSACTCSSLQDGEPPASSASAGPPLTFPAGCNSQPAEAKTEAQDWRFHPTRQAGRKMKVLELTTSQ